MHTKSILIDDRLSLIGSFNWDMRSAYLDTELMLLVEKINELGTTMLVVTHEKELVNMFTKRVIAIEDGRIISDETGGYYKNEEII